MTSSAVCTARVDFTCPLDASTHRLQCSFAAPLQILQAKSPQQLLTVLQQAEQAARQGLWCVGGLSYEAASALNPALSTHAPATPLAWFAVFEQPLASPSSFSADTQVAAEIVWREALSRREFDAHLQHIHDAIAAGAYYQVNYTQQLRGSLEQPINSAALFAGLQQAQPDGYGLYLDMGDAQVASVSPELFFDWHQPAQGHASILTRPMKGTAARGATAQQDAAQAQRLQQSVKERAENVMIVDLLRNDLSTIAQTGTVRTPSLFDVQALPTVWQMTSDVRAQLPHGTSLLQIFQGLFPCGSVTGAPKRAAMQAIADLETEPRGWYCGALGAVRPDGLGGIRATFNVPIRTVVISKGAKQSMLRCGIGSGITADATAAGEWQEWRHKRAFIERVSAKFDLLTTMALEHGSFRHEDLHQQRMQEAAAHFGFVWHLHKWEKVLQQLRCAQPVDLWRVRITLDKEGYFHHQIAALDASPVEVTLQLAPHAMAEAHSEFVRFKTTRRAHYDCFTPQPPFFDTVLWNEAGEITESTRGNIAALIDGQWVTPPLRCGLLNGVGRQVALADGRLIESVIRVSDVPKVRQWAFINSLRGWLAARLISQVST